ncbi:MAG: DMT family transporter [Bacteroidota bacterium]
MQAILFVIMAIIAGILIPVQAGLNAQLGNALKSPLYGALVSFIIGTLGLLAYCLLSGVDFGTFRQSSQLPWYYYTGGIMGAFFVITLIVAPPTLGMAFTLGITIAAQLAFGLLMDHFGWFGAEQVNVSWGKMGGVALIVLGVILLRN